MKHWRSLLLSFLVVSVAGLALAQDVPAKAGSGPPLKPQPQKASMQLPHTYGTSNSSFYRMGGSEFTGMQTGGSAQDLWNDTYYSVGSTIRRFGTAANTWLIGTPHLPSGALVLTVNIEDCVNNTNTISGDIYSCGNDGSGCTVLAPITSELGCGFDAQDISAANYVVDNGPFGNYLVIRVNVTNTDGSDSIAGASIEYLLQVSPAPLTPTFLDVPTSDFGFQYIEALNASGITGGCGGGNYCPDANVTRRQMAIFIAKALGLSFR